MIMPSMTACGSPSRTLRSMKAPGSPSSALQRTYFTSPGPCGVKSHFMPGGEAGAAAAAQARLLHLVDDLLRASSR